MRQNEEYFANGTFCTSNLLLLVEISPSSIVGVRSPPRDLILQDLKTLLGKK